MSAIFVSNVSSFLSSGFDWHETLSWFLSSCLAWSLSVFLIWALMSVFVCLWSSRSWHFLPLCLGILPLHLWNDLTGSCLLSVPSACLSLSVSLLLWENIACPFSSNFSDSVSLSTAQIGKTPPPQLSICAVCAFLLFPPLSHLSIFLSCILCPVKISFVSSGFDCHHSICLCLCVLRCLSFYPRSPL